MKFCHPISSQAALAKAEGHQGKTGGNQGPEQTWPCRHLEAAMPELGGGAEIPEEATVNVCLVPGFPSFMEKTRVELNLLN